MRQYMRRVEGNRALCEKLCRDVLANKLSHACILEGADGTGKHLIAMQTAAALACSRKGVSGADVPCCECAECRKVLEGKSPDVITVGCDGKATLGVDTVRFLKEDVPKIPNDLDFKLYIIEDADKMTPHAQNAFLLTLEEPPSFVRFMLLCENAELLLQTVRSRAPVLRTMGVPDDRVDAYVCAHDPRAAQMKATAPTEYAELIRAAEHGIGRALEFLEPKVYAPVRDVRRQVTEFLDAATSGTQRQELFAFIPSFSSKRDVFTRQLTALSQAAADLAVLKKDPSAETTFFADRSRALEMCDRCSMSFLYELSEAALTAIDSNSRNANAYLTLIKLFADANLM